MLMTTLQKPQTTIGARLQRFNFIAGSLHFIQAVILFVILNYELQIPVVTRFFDQTAEGIRPVTEILFDLPVAVIAPIFLLLSAGFHFLLSPPYYIRRYEKNIASGINPMRWVEYSLSSSLMISVLMMLGGLNDLPSIVFIFTLNFMMNMMGLVMELYNQGAKKVKWLPFNLGVIAGIVPWIIGGLYFWVSTSNIADAIPAYAQAGFILTFIFFNSFAINMWLQYKKVGPWKDYAFGERMYIVLSLVAKTALAWVLVLGTIEGVSA